MTQRFSITQLTMLSSLHDHFIEIAYWQHSALYNQWLSTVSFFSHSLPIKWIHGRTRLTFVRNGTALLSPLSTLVVLQCWDVSSTNNNVDTLNTIHVCLGALLYLSELICQWSWHWAVASGKTIVARNGLFDKTLVSGSETQVEYLHKRLCRVEQTI